MLSCEIIHQNDWSIERECIILWHTVHLRNNAGLLQDSTLPHQTMAILISVFFIIFFFQQAAIDLNVLLSTCKGCHKIIYAFLKCFVKEESLRVVHLLILHFLAPRIWYGYSEILQAHIYSKIRRFNAKVLYQYMILYQ